MAINLKLYVLEKDYKIFASSLWPSFQDYLNGAKGSTPEIQDAIDKFTEEQIALGPKKSFNTIWTTKYKPANFDDENHDLEYKRKAFNLPSIKNDIKVKCSVPTSNVTIDAKGRVFVCYCDGFVPFPVGHVMDFNNFDEITNSPVAIEIQESIARGEYNFCATQLCGIKYQQPPPEHTILPHKSVFIQIDISCNISCPSCRERLVFIKDEDIINKLFSWTERIKSWIAQSPTPVMVELAGGDPFASILYTRVIESYSELSNVKFNIKTNGLLLQKNFHILNKIKNAVNFSISIDAATKETYELVRRGGSWDKLISNLEYFSTLDIQGVANFVIQKANYKECIDFVKFCNQYKLTPAFTILQDWGTWDNFDEQCVHIPTSPHYNEFKEIFKHEIFKSVNLAPIKSWL